MTRVLAVAVLLVIVAVVVVAFTQSPDDVVVGDGSDADVPSEARTAVPGASADAAERTEPTVEIPNEGPAMSLEDLDGWLQTDITALQDTRGKVTVVQFWTFDCANCRNTLANMAELYARHGSGQGPFEIVGVHAPEFDHERDPAAVATAAQELNVTWPIALDTTKRNFHDWQPGSRAFWPRTYVLDRDGDIRFDHIGEGAYDELNATVAALIADPSL